MFMFFVLFLFLLLFSSRDRSQCPVNVRQRALPLSFSQLVLNIVKYF